MQTADNAQQGNDLAVNFTAVFPTPVLTFTDEKGINLPEMDYINNLDYIDNFANQTTVHTAVLQNKKLKRLEAWIYKALERYVQEVYAPEEDVDLKITQSWCNKSLPGQSHHAHCHHNSLVSGVYYVQTTDEDKITFLNRDFSQLRIETNSFNSFNSLSWWVPAEQGTLVLFPSTLQHQVEEVVGTQARISLSFNTFPSGLLGNKRSLTQLEIK